MNVEVIVPEDFMGDVIGDLSGKRGKILGMESRGRNQVVKARVPLSEIAKYATELRSITHGRGTYGMELSHYEQVPGDVTEKIIAQSKED
jgi:elongation factor G